MDSGIWMKRKRIAGAVKQKPFQIFLGVRK
jgi:hypothetical protein